jgi:aldehyde dehydrogenase
MDGNLVTDVVTEVMRRLSGAAKSADVTSSVSSPSSKQAGVFNLVDDAVNAAKSAQLKLARLSIEKRDAIVRRIKQMAVDHSRSWGMLELQETKIGRIDHKVAKLVGMAGVPGVEFLKTAAFSGSHGLSLDEHSPFGVIGAITPVTHSIPTLTCNAINMIAAGNTVVVNPHPSGARCAAVAVDAYNRAIELEFGIRDLITLIASPSLESAQQVFDHRDVSMIVVTGGAAVAKAALMSRKRAVVAGPGNPPVVVDETACLPNAARSIVEGAAFDNNLLCIGEKQIFVVSSVFDGLIAELKHHGAHFVSEIQLTKLTDAAFVHNAQDSKISLSKHLVGKDPSVLANAMGVNLSSGSQLLVGVTQADHPFVQHEQMMPFLPIVKCKDFDEAVDHAVQSEHGYRHTAIIHSRRIDRIGAFSRKIGTTIFVANGPSIAGLGLGGEGYGSYSIATPTGEGLTTPLTFTRFRRIAVADGSLRMI